MKIKNCLVIVKMDDHYIAVPSEELGLEFNGMIKLNESGAFIVGLLNNEISREDLINKIMMRYSIDFEDATRNLESITTTLEKYNLLV